MATHGTTRPASTGPSNRRKYEGTPIDRCAVVGTGSSRDDELAGNAGKCRYGQGSSTRPGQTRSSASGYPSQTCRSGNTCCASDASDAREGTSASVSSQSGNTCNARYTGGASGRNFGNARDGGSASGGESSDNARDVRDACCTSNPG